MESNVHIFSNPADELLYLADPKGFFNEKLTGPTFIGQGLSIQVGSDCYCQYIVEKKVLPNKKTIWGIAHGKSHYKSDWTDGIEICDGPTSWRADFWIMSWGRTKSGSPKWWQCNENGKRMNGRRYVGRFDGAYAYRNPSF